MTKRTRRRAFLDEINLVVPWKELVALIGAFAVETLQLICGFIALVLRSLKKTASAFKDFFLPLGQSVPDTHHTPARSSRWFFAPWIASSPTLTLNFAPKYLTFCYG